MDAWCTPLIFDEVVGAFNAIKSGRAPELGTVVAYEQYIHWLFRQDQEKARAYWRDALQGLSAPTPIGIDTAVPDKHQRRMGLQYLEIQPDAPERR